MIGPASWKLRCQPAGRKWFGACGGQRASLLRRHIAFDVRQKLLEAPIGLLLARFARLRHALADYPTLTARMVPSQDNIVQSQRSQWKVKLVVAKTSATAQNTHLVHSRTNPSSHPGMEVDHAGRLIELLTESRDTCKGFGCGLSIRSVVIGSATR